MRANFFIIISLISALTSATAIPDAALETKSLVVREDLKEAEGFAAAAACKCKKVSNPGLYCGFCKAAAGTGVGPGNNYINTVYIYNVAWCSTSGACDDYGYSSHCAAGEARGCKGIDAW
jgi:hypothetical protein